MTRHYSNFHTFISKLGKDCNSSINITAEAKDIINGLVYGVCEKYAQYGTRLCKYGSKITLDSNIIKTLTRIWLGPYANELIEYANNVWDTYSSSDLKGVSKYTKAGIQLPPTRIRNILSEYLLMHQKIGETCYIFLTAIIEYIIRKLLNHAILLASKESKITITGRFLYLAINSVEFEDLRPLFTDIFIAGFGSIGDQMLLDAQESLLDKLTLNESDCDTESTSEETITE